MHWNDSHTVGTEAHSRRRSPLGWPPSLPSPCRVGNVSGPGFRAVECTGTPCPSLSPNPPSLQGSRHSECNSDGALALAMLAIGVSALARNAPKSLGAAKSSLTVPSCASQGKPPRRIARLSGIIHWASGSPNVVSAIIRSRTRHTDRNSRRCAYAGACNDNDLSRASEDICNSLQQGWHRLYVWYPWKRHCEECCNSDVWRRRNEEEGGKRRRK